MTEEAVLEEKNQEEKKQAKPSYKILVVDDEKKILTVAQKIFSSAGYKIDVTDDPNKALDMMSENGPYAVILSDNKMKGIRGTELFEKAKCINPNTVRILTSAYSDKQLMEDMVNKGETFRFIKKPIDFKLAFKFIQESIRKYEDNLKIKRQEEEYEEMAKANESLKEKANGLNENISGLKKTTKKLVGAIGFLIVLFLAVWFFPSYQENDKLEKTSVQMGQWVVYKNGTAIDTETQLMWMTADYRNINKLRPKNWADAVQWKDKINKKEFAGYSDWRLPTSAELKSTYDNNETQIAYDHKKKYKVGYPQAFRPGGGYGFWTSDEVGLNSAKYFFFIGGYEKTVSKDFASPAMSVRLVRTAD